MLLCCTTNCDFLDRQNYLLTDIIYYPTPFFRSLNGIPTNNTLHATFYFRITLILLLKPTGANWPSSYQYPTEKSLLPKPLLRKSCLYCVHRQCAHTGRQEGQASQSFHSVWMNGTCLLKSCNCQILAQSVWFDCCQVVKRISTNVTKMLLK